MTCPHRRPTARPRRRTGRGLLLALALAGGCQTFRAHTPPADAAIKPKAEPVAATVALPTRHSLRVSQYYFFADFELKPDLALFRELSDLREQVVRELQLPTANNVIQVFVFENRDRYERFMQTKYPDLPKRRAFFVAQPRSVGGPEDLFVYTYWGDRVREDLRHELTHALLHSVLQNVPLWLDEGLAEYFELPPERKGVNTHHLDQLRRGAFKPDLARLEQLSQVQQMTPPEYREAWAWVHLMLADRPEARTVLLAYLNQLRSTPNPGPLQPRLAGVYPELDEALERHLAQL